MKTLLVTDISANAMPTVSACSQSFTPPFWLPCAKVLRHQWQKIHQVEFLARDPRKPKLSNVLAYRRFVPSELQKHARNPRSAEYEFWLSDHLDSSLSLNLVSESYTFDPFFCINPLSEEISERLGVIMDQNWVDLERVLEWIRSCDTTHGKCHCQTLRAGGSISSRDMYLISVSNNCLVKANNGDKYIALSYVWGACSRQFKALKANLELLKRKDSLSNTIIRDHVPHTIQRAMRFTSLLGLDLLWVDRFCAR